MQISDEALSSISPAGRSICENAHNSLTTWYTLIRFCIHFNIGTDMLNGDEPLPNISLVGFLSLSENANAKDEHICDKKQSLFKERLQLIASYSCTVTNYCKVKVLLILYH